MVSAGIVLVTYKVNWQILSAFKKPAEAPPPEPEAAPQTKVGAWLLASPTPKTVGKGFFELIAHDASHVIPQIIDYLATVPEVDPARLGVAGVSTSGFTALEAVALDRRLKAAAVVVACGDYHTFLRASRLGMDGKPLDLDPDYERWLRTQEPIRHPERVVHAAVLMVNGSEDTAVPMECALETSRAFRRAYARAGVPERFRFVFLPGGGHNLDGTATHEVLAWWYRWLLAPR